MRFKNAMSFKAKIKQIALQKGITPQQVQQNYLIEVFLSKLAQSKYREQFIIKGGYLIGGIVGLDLRATMDLDTTIKGFELNPENLLSIAKEVVALPTEDSFKLEVEGVDEIREADDYPGYRLKIIATFERIKEPITLDVTTGDVITPREVDFNFYKMFSEEKIALLAYPLETVLAEKIETILSRGIATTRPRDFYDVYLLYKLKGDVLHYPTLQQALRNTQTKRQSNFEVSDFSRILTDIQNSDFQQELWKKYQRQYAYARTTTFNDLFDVMKQLLTKIVEHYS